MRSIWAGAISFGLVVIPVKLYAATEQRDIAFRQVHRQDGARIQFRRFCTLDGEEVPYSDVAKGFELPTGDMVVLTDEDLADLPLVTAHRIEVLHFAPSAQVEPIYAAKSYYTEPDPAGVRAYVLFRDALENSGKVAVAKVALRQREALAALRVREGVITLETLLWPDEVRKPDFGFLDEDIEVRSQELKMAASLIDTMTEDFDPDQYHDSYREALEAVVRAKVEGNDVVRPDGLDLPDRGGFGPAGGPPTLDQRVFLLPQARLLAILSGAGDQLFLQRFDLDTALEKSGIDYLVVTSQPEGTASRGMAFEYPANGAANVGRRSPAARCWRRTATRPGVWGWLNLPGRNSPRGEGARFASPGIGETAGPGQPPEAGFQHRTPWC